MISFFAKKNQIFRKCSFFNLTIFFIVRDIDQQSKMSVFEVHSNATISIFESLFRLIDEHLTNKSFDLFTSRNDFDNIKSSKFRYLITTSSTIESLFIFKELRSNKRQFYSRTISSFSFIVFYFFNKTFYSIDITRRRFFKLKRDIRIQRRDFHHIADSIFEIQLKTNFESEYIFFYNYQNSR